MASYRLSMSTVGRRTGRSVVAAIAYQHGTAIEQTQGLKHYTGSNTVHDYSRKQGVLDSFLLVPRNAPDWARDRAQLWNHAEAAENRKNSVTGREIQLSLPHELTLDDHRIMTRRFAERLSRRYEVAVDIAIHAPDREGDARNVHAHMMLTTRRLTAEGFGEKTRELDTRDKSGSKEVEWMREEWATIQNSFLIDRGFEAVDHRSYRRRGIDKEAQPKLGPTASAMERRGVETDRGDLLRDWEVREVERQRQRDQEIARDKAVTDRELYRAGELEPPALTPAQQAEEWAAEKRRENARNRIEYEADQLESWRAERFEQLMGRHLSEMDQLRERHRMQAEKHEALMETTYGQYLRQDIAEAAVIHQTLRRAGVRGFMVNLTVEAKAMREELAALRLSIKDGRTRLREATEAFQQGQDKEMHAVQQRHEEGQQDYHRRLHEVRGLYGAKLFDREERDRLAANQDYLRQFDRENAAARANAAQEQERAEELYERGLQEGPRWFDSRENEPTNDNDREHESDRSLGRDYGFER